MNQQNLDWSLWRTFLAILREGSLSGAARALAVAHPTVRRHLHELETRLGAALFVRSPSGLIATEGALRLREGAQGMESAAALLARTAIADTDAVTGTVRITASEIVGVEYLPPILRTLQARHPKLSVELSLSNSIEDMLRHDADIAVRMTRPTQDGLLARKIGLIPVGLYAHETWIAHHGEPGSLADVLATNSLIGYDRNPASIQALAAIGLQAAQTNFGFRSDSGLAQLAALRAGVGVGACQHHIAARDPKLRHVVPSFTVSLEMWLVTHPDLRHVNRVRAALDGLAGGLTEAIHQRP